MKVVNVGSRIQVEAGRAHQCSNAEKGANRNSWESTGDIFELGKMSRNTPSTCQNGFMMKTKSPNRLRVPPEITLRSCCFVSCIITPLSRANHYLCVSAFSYLFGSQVSLWLSLTFSPDSLHYGVSMLCCRAFSCDDR